MTAKNPLTREESNLHRFYHALLEQGDPPSSQEYAPFGDLSDIAVEMFNSRVKKGIKGLKEYIAKLSNIKDTRYKRLLKILSSATLEQAEGELGSPMFGGTLLSDVEEEQVKWLWKNWLALSKITMLDGDPG